MEDEFPLYNFYFVFLKIFLEKNKKYVFGHGAYYRTKLVPILDIVCVT